MKLHSRLGNCGSYCNTSFECLTTLRYNSLVVFGSTQSFDSSLRYSRDTFCFFFSFRFEFKMTLARQTFPQFLKKILFPTPASQSLWVKFVNWAVHAIQVIIRAVGIAGRVSCEEAAEAGVVVAETEIVDSKQLTAFFRTELADIFAGTSGSGFCTPRSVVRGADHRAGIVGQGAGRTDRVVQEVFPLATASILRIHHIADATAIASGTYQKSFQRAFGIVFLNRNTTVIEITYCITVFRFFKATGENEKSEKKSIRKGKKERVQDFLLPMRRCSRILDINTVAVIRFYSHLAGNYKK